MFLYDYGSFSGGSVVKNQPASAGEAGGPGLTPESGRSLKKELATCSSILAWEIPWTEEPGGLCPWGRKELDMTEQLSMHIATMDIYRTQLCNWLQRKY